MKIIKEIKQGWEQRGNLSLRKTIVNIMLIVIGFILSPLSWWNDLFINVPIAWAFAFIVGKAITLWTAVSIHLFTFLFLVGYIISNIIGFLMMDKGTRAILQKDKTKNIIWSVGLAIIYSIVVVWLGSQEIAESLNIIPQWVR